MGKKNARKNEVTAAKALQEEGLTLRPSRLDENDEMGDVEMGAASGSSRSRSARSVTFNPSSAAVKEDDNGGSSSSDTEDEFDPVESKNLEEEEGLFRSQSMLDFSSRSSGVSDEGMKRSSSFSIDSLRMRRREEAFLLRQSTLIMRGPRILHMKGEE